MLEEKDYELISQSLDGQLSPEQDAAFKKRLLQEPELNREYQNLKANDDKLKKAFATIDDKPLPQGLDKLLNDTPQQKKSSNIRYLAMAASVLAVSVLSYFGIQNDNSMAMSPALTAALNNTPSMTPVQLDDDTQFIVNQTFRHKDGFICRVYMTQDTSIRARSVACKKKQKWQLEAGEQSVLSQDEHFVTASDQDANANVDHYLSLYKQGEQLTAEQEASYIKAP